MSDEKKCDNSTSFVIGIFGGLAMGGFINFMILLDILKLKLINVIIINVFISLIVHSITLFYNINYNQPYDVECNKQNPFDFDFYWFAIGFHTSHLLSIFVLSILLHYHVFPQQQGPLQDASQLDTSVETKTTTGGGRRRRRRK